ncbi:hypothetical protein ATCVTN60342_024R [Acanthocystis turfacea Chlorella virus TN603.4.2]|nr:hypothetical protein ATCVTN60342_024R [Acanthocystis turfacea Chlorella virus TN603.4.2]
MTTNVEKFFADYPIPAARELLFAEYPGAKVEIHSWLLGGSKEYMRIQTGTHTLLSIDDMGVSKKRFIKEIDDLWGLSFFCAYFVNTKNAAMSLQAACAATSVSTIRTSTNMIRINRARNGFDIRVDGTYVGFASNSASVYELVRTKVSDSRVQYVYIIPDYD